MLGAFNRLRRAKTVGFSFGSLRKYREGPDGRLSNAVCAQMCL